MGPQAKALHTASSELVIPNVLLWDVGCFEMRAVLASGSRETSESPLNYLEEIELGALPIIKRLSAIICC